MLRAKRAPDACVPCPVCARNNRERTARIWYDEGNVFCHRCKKNYPADNEYQPPANLPEPKPSGQRWSDLAEAIWLRARPLTGQDPGSRYLSRSRRRATDQRRREVATS